MMIVPPALHVRCPQTIFCLAALLGFAIPTAQPQSLSAPAQSQLTLQVRVPLVLEDVVVLDSKNQPVHNLKAADFTITDEGKPVTPQNFEEHAAPTPAQQAALQASAPKPPALGVNVFTNYTATPPNSPLNILLFDALNTPMTDQVTVRRQMLKYLNEQPANARIAIFGLGSHLYLLQGFTSDPAALKAAINTRGAGVQASALLAKPVDGQSEGGLYDDGVSCFLDLDPKACMEDQYAKSTTERVGFTLAALNQLAHYLSALPGRKNLIWFSAAFPLLIQPDLSLANPDGTLTPIGLGDGAKDTFKVAAHYGEQVRQTDELLARSQVAIYPVDARGLFGKPAVPEGDPMGDPITAAPHCISPCSPTGAAFLQSDANFLQQTAAEHQTMNQMAYDTGGKAFYNNGDLKAAVESAIAFGSNYYTMSYTPPSGKWDGKYHKIDVKVNHPGLHLSYRRGYYADDPALDSHGKKQAQTSAMQAAMLHGAPAPSELIFDARVIPDDGTMDKLSPGSHPDSKLMQPPYRSYTLDTLLDIHNMQMTRTGTGAYEGSLEFTVLVYNANGAVLNTKTRSAHFNLPPDRYADLLAHGVSASQSIDVPVKGNYFLRIGMHDPASGKIGAVEIPVSALKSRQAMIAAAGQSATAPQ